MISLLRTPNLAIRNISSLMTMVSRKDDPVGLMQDAAILIEDGHIRFVGENAECPTWSGESFDARGLVIMPGLIDCHTHLVFAGDRVDDFYARAKGDTYAQIMARGGGIQHTVNKTRNASEQELVDGALPRLAKMASQGVCTVEVKSGYGLSLSEELKILRVIKRLNVEQTLTLVPTFMGAHAIAPEFNGDSKAYTTYLIDTVLPQVVKEGLAKAIDVFAENVAFSLDDAERLLTKGRDLGLATRVHADQLSHFGGTALAARLKATSASHLEYASDEELAALAQNGVVAEVLPLSELYLGMSQVVNARKLCDLGVKVAIGTDFNPGSSMCNDLLLAMRLAITHKRMTVEEAYLGVTHHAACALDMQNEVGQVKVGMRGALCVFKGPSPWTLAQDWTLAS